MIRERRPLLSRVADSVYWMARYIERAENVARFIGVNLHLQLDLPLAPAHQWQPLIDTAGDTETFKERYGEASEENVIRFLAFDDENPNSIFSCRSMRSNSTPTSSSLSGSILGANCSAIVVHTHAARAIQNVAICFMGDPFAERCLLI